jgi:hypothetical protein
MMPLVVLASQVYIMLADVTPSPTPAPGVNPDLVTPGVWGFVISIGVAVATVLLIIDMTRRMRRIRYRAAAQEQLLAEQVDAASEEEPKP